MWENEGKCRLVGYWNGAGLQRALGRFVLGIIFSHNCIKLSVDYGMNYSRKNLTRGEIIWSLTGESSRCSGIPRPELLALK